jgi:hypothetical protein
VKDGLAMGGALRIHNIFCLMQPRHLHLGK